MSLPHVRVPLSQLGGHSDFMLAHKPNLEIFLSSDDLDSNKPSVIASTISDALNYGPDISIHAPFMDLSPGAVDSEVASVTARRFIECIEVAGAISARTVVFHSGYEKWKYDHKVEPWLARSLEFWPHIIMRAADRGVKVAIENIFEEEPGTLRLLMEGLNAENAGICFDPGHFNLFTRLPLQAWLEAIGEYIIELHLHDNMGDRDMHMPPGDGNFDFEALFDYIRGRDVLLTIEAKNEADTLTSLERVKKLLD